jgi:hypothetical protein
LGLYAVAATGDHFLIVAGSCSPPAMSWRLAAAFCSSAQVAIMSRPARISARVITE